MNKMYGHGYKHKPQKKSITSNIVEEINDIIKILKAKDTKDINKL